MKIFEHYVLTVFNVDRGFDQANERNNLDYLEQRFEIFESITIPSIVGQTKQSFFWYVFFDSQTPDKFKQRAQEVLTLTNCLPVYVKNQSEIISFLKAKISPETECLITTNLDNDDALNKTFIQILQSNLRDEESYFLNFTLGYMLRHEGLFMREFLSSPFHTLVEVVKAELLTCLSIPHYSILSQGISVYQIAASPAWLQMIHDTNIANRWDTNAVLVSDLSKLNDFSIDISSPFLQKTLSESKLNKIDFIRTLLMDKTKSYPTKVKLTIETLLPSLTLAKLKLKSIFEGR